MEPARFDEMRKGCWDIHARIADMDVAGIWASASASRRCSPASRASRSRASQDQELGLACVRAWNDWHHEVWAGTYPERIIPLQLPWLRDPEVAADEVRRNAERGFKAVSFPESPANLEAAVGAHRPLGPVPRARARRPTPSCASTPASGSIAPPTLTGVAARAVHHAVPGARACSRRPTGCGRIPLRFPELKIALSEGGIGWVPMLLDRLDYVVEHSASGMADAWGDGDLTPVGGGAAQLLVLHASTTRPRSQVRDRIGVDHIMVESDYPHADSSWPDTQALLAERFAGLPDADVAKLTYENAARLFRHPPPPAEWVRA